MDTSLQDIPLLELPPQIAPGGSRATQDTIECALADLRRRTRKSGLHTLCKPTPCLHVGRVADARSLPTQSQCPVGHRLGTARLRPELARVLGRAENPRTTDSTFVRHTWIRGDETPLLLLHETAFKQRSTRLRKWHAFGKMPESVFAVELSPQTSFVTRFVAECL